MIYVKITYKDKGGVKMGQVTPITAETVEDMGVYIFAAVINQMVNRIDGAYTNLKVSIHEDIMGEMMWRPDIEED